jgi:hypothetical protein
MQRRSLTILLALVLLGYGPSITRTLGQTLSIVPARTTAPVQAGEITVTIPEQFVNSFLEAVFTELRAPAFPLAATNSNGRPIAAVGRDISQENCESVIVLEKEVNGVKTAVHFEQGRMVALLAFSGSFNNSLVGCLRFQGSASSLVNLEFDGTRQTLQARATVSDIGLEGVPALGKSVVVRLVQSALDKKINPIQILQTKQISGLVPVAASKGSLDLRAKEIRPEIVPGTLHLHITYEITAAR